MAAVTLAVYWPVCLNGFVNYDDQEYITANSHVQHGFTWQSVAWAFRTGHAANWHPLTWLSHMLDIQLFGLNPAAHHLTSLCFHVANTLLLFLLLCSLTAATWRSAAVAALFALHPLHVESVAWIAERKDVLSAFFGLLALWAYGRYASAVPTTERPKWRWYFGALGCFALGLMSKPMLVTLPFVLLLLDIWPLQRLHWGTAGWHSAGRLLLEKTPFLVLSALSCVVTLVVQEKAMQFHKQLAFHERAANALVAYVRYLGKTFWPQDLAVPYPHPSHVPFWQAGGALLLLGTVTALVLLGLRKRPWLVVGWLWFLVTLVPVLGLVQVGVQAMADRYTYLPLIGVFILLVWTCSQWLASSRLSGRLGFIVFLAVLVPAAWRTRSQVQLWQSTESLFNHAVAVTRDNWVAHYNLALLALRRYQALQYGDVQHEQLELAPFALSPAASDSTPRECLEQIIVHCQAVLAARPGYPDPHITLAKALAEQGQLDAARTNLETAIRLAPGNAEAHQNLAELLYRQGQPPKAIAEYQAALRLKPDWTSVLNNLAWLLATHPKAEVRRGPEALRLSQRACELTGHTNFWFLQTLAAAYAENAQFTNAIRTVQQARQVALQAGLPDLVARAEARRKLYQAGQPCRD